MSSFASFFRTLPDTLQQPTALAMLGSVGAHLLIFATLPAFTSSSEPRPEAEVRRVRLLEPPQGSNPQASSQLALPPVPNPPNSKTQLPITAQGRSAIPNPLYTIPDLNSPVTLNPPPPIPTPTQPQISQADRFNELLRRLAAQQPRIVPPPKPPAPTPTTQPSPQPNISISPNSSIAGLTPANPNDVAKVTPPSTEAPSPAPTTTQSPAPATTQSPAPTTSNDQLLAATRYNPEGTSQQDSVQAAQKLTEELTAKDTPWEYVRLRQPQEPLKELDYPLAFPLSNYKQHPIAIAIFIGKDGKPLADRKPQILNSTGYPILNDKAIEYVQKDANQPDRFPAIAEDKIRVFVYEFQFKAPNMGTASTPQSRG
ncbi:hypothetical protein [Leptolyngbya sp. FACHB-17]|uniref:hypothetical protein n=1 Tax=unclassified Leptolyngbya TaxID=2650499 RepID=UPI0016801687|nr:hypothetical protein [Leptolyngbya sp. FACHB-17]MBD2081021.1 hypothetical protein [Leptolyngbya sp. FACHB-17]